MTSQSSTFHFPMIPKSYKPNKPEIPLNQKGLRLGARELPQRVKVHSIF